MPPLRNKPHCKTKIVLKTGARKNVIISIQLVCTQIGCVGISDTPSILTLTLYYTPCPGACWDTHTPVQAHSEIYPPLWTENITFASRSVKIQKREREQRSKQWAHYSEPISKNHLRESVFYVHIEVYPGMSWIKRGTGKYHKMSQHPESSVCRVSSSSVFVEVCLDVDCCCCSSSSTATSLVFRRCVRRCVAGRWRAPWSVQFHAFWSPSRPWRLSHHRSDLQRLLANLQMFSL